MSDRPHLAYHKRRLGRIPAAGFCFACLLLAGAAAIHAAPALTATLDRTSVPLGETLNLTLTFDDITPNAAPALPNLPNVRSNPPQASSFINIINGQRTAQIKFTYELMPTQPGDVVIPAISVNAGGRVFSTQPLTFKVLPQGTADPKQPQQAFLRIAAPKPEVYVGEAFALEVSLYWQNGRDIQTPQVKAEGFSLSQTPEYNETQVAVGNVGYHLLVFRYAATPARAGELVLGPAECTMTLLIPLPQNQVRDPFGFFASNVQRRQVRLQSDPLPMRVVPLPTQGSPASFNGAVGQFAMTVTAGPTTLSVGDPITVKINIAGRGLLDAVNLPEQPDWRDFKVYPATSSVKAENSLGLEGAKFFEQVVVPQNHEIKSLPPVRFSFFDPNLKAYRTLTNAPIALTVGHAALTSTPLPPLTNQTDRAPAPVDDIIHIKARMDGVMAWQTPLVRQPWFLLLQGIPVAAWAGLVLWRKQRESLANNPKLRRRREVAQRVRDGLRELRQYADNQQAESFYACLFRVLQEQLGERLDLPASAITEAVIDERLRGRGPDESSLSDLHELFQTCNQARYAPVQTSQAMAGLLPKVESVLTALQGLHV